MLDGAKLQAQPKRTSVRKKSFQHGHTLKGTLRDTASPTGSTQYCSEGTEGKNEEKLSKLLNKKTLLRRSLQHKLGKGSIYSDLIKPASPEASTRRSTDFYDSEFGGDTYGRMKPLSQLHEPHTQESLFPNLMLQSNRGNAASITPIKPHPASFGYMQYLTDLISGDIDPPGDESSRSVQTRSKNQSFLPPIDHAHKGHGHHAGTVKFNSTDSIDPSLLENIFRSGSKNVRRSVYWAKTVPQKSKLKNSEIESSASAGGRVSRILKKVLVSMENKPQRL